MDILLKNVTLIDGTGRAPQTDSVIAIQDGKILYAGPASGWSDVREESITLDLGGQFALPGLIDTHVHLAGSGEADSQFRAEDGAMALKMLRNAQKNLAAGSRQYATWAGGMRSNSSSVNGFSVGSSPVRACAWRGGSSRSQKPARNITKACTVLPMAWTKSARRCVNR